MTRTMKYVTAITPICFLIHGKDGFTELCEYLQCIPSDEYWELLRKGEREKTSTLYPYKLLRVVDEPDSDDTLSLSSRDINADEMDYPCILSMVDDTFECNSYTFFVNSLDSENVFLSLAVLLNKEKKTNETYGKDL